MSKFAYVTVANGDVYLKAAAVLAQGLRSAGAKHPLLVLQTSKTNCTATCRCVRGLLHSLAAIVRDQEPIEAPPSTHRQSSHWSKLLYWRQVDYDRLVGIDLDTVVLRNPDPLFAMRGFAVGQDPPLPCYPAYELPRGDASIGLTIRTIVWTRAYFHAWRGKPTRANSGLVSLRPNEATYRALIRYAEAHKWRTAGDDHIHDQGVIDGYYFGSQQPEGSRLLGEDWFSYALRCICTGGRHPSVTLAGTPAPDPAIAHFGSFDFNMATALRVRGPLSHVMPMRRMPNCSRRYLDAWQNQARQSRLHACASAKAGSGERDVNVLY